MQSHLRFLTLSVMLISLSGGCNNQPTGKLNPQVQVVDLPEKQRVEVTVDGKLFTSFLYTDTIPDLKKTVLFPLVSAGGNIVTRGFPLQPRPGERVDHPHHIGMWLNYGEVNNLDYWGNSNAIPASRFNEMGVIRNAKIVECRSGAGEGILEVEDHWLKPDQRVLLRENSRFVFKTDQNSRTIDRTTTLTALDESVHFNDTKEGMMAIRVARELEHPSDKPIVLSDSHGNKTAVPVLDNAGVTGHYLNSNGVEGMDVWGKRANWVALSGTINNEKIAIVIFDHPQNVGHPSYWHARGYGLFAINPLGQRVFSKGKESMDLMLQPGQSVTFRYRVFIVSGEIDAEQLNAAWDTYAKTK